jgi:hypothetical protein
VIIMAEQDLHTADLESTVLVAPPAAAVREPQQQQQRQTITVVEEVLEDPDLLELVFSFLPVAADLSRCAAVNTAFRAASGAVGTAMVAPSRRRCKRLGCWS